MKLSIIIPYYNAEPYTSELLGVLAPQMNNSVECLVIDDGSPKPFKTTYKWVKVIRKENGGPASARNMGIENAKGRYLAFIDADDLVADYYVERVLKEIDATDADVIDFSWKSLDNTGVQHNIKLPSSNAYLNNPSVCTRAFKRSFIGDHRMNEKKDATEDEDFSRKVGYLERGTFTHSAITDYMYFYRTAVPESNVKTFKAGLTKTKRIVYYYKKVTRNMTWLLDEIKKEDEVNEVILVTENNEIPALKRYCQILHPGSIWGHQLRGEPYSKFIKIEPPVRAQVIFYCEHVDMVSGLTTFLYNTCVHLKEIYDVMLLYDRFDPVQYERFRKVVRLMRNDHTRRIVCDTLVVNRLLDKIPSNVSFKKSVQMCHACCQKGYNIPQNRDYIVNVSQASKETWGKESERGIVIHNLSLPQTDELMIVSATRIGASDKGNNDKRMRILARMLNEKNIPFVWLNFSDRALTDAPKNFINMGPRINVQSFMKRADYVALLSDREAYSMEILEALCLNKPLIVTDFPSLYEEGFVNGVHGYVVPKDMNFDVTKLLKIPEFNFEYDNGSIIEQWKGLLESPNPMRKTEFNPDQDDRVNVRVIKSFKDRHTGQIVPRGNIVMSRARVNEILEVQRIQRIRLIEIGY